MDKCYAGVHWDTNDLFGCKQAVKILFCRENVPAEVIKSLDFGSLWVDSVLEELEYKLLIHTISFNASEEREQIKRECNVYHSDVMSLK